MEWIIDEETNNSRVMIGIGKFGVTIKSWIDAVDPWEDGEYYFREATYSWSDVFKAFKSPYAKEGRMVRRIRDAAQYLLYHHGTSSDACGPVTSLHHAYDSGYIYRA